MFSKFVRKEIRNSITQKRSKTTKGLSRKFKKKSTLKFHIHSFGNKNPNKKFYVIQRYIGGGMFSNLLFVINHIKIALDMGCIPIVDMENFPTKYNEKKRFKNTLNSWEYYFKPLNKFRLDDVYKSKFVIIVDGKTRLNKEFDSFVNLDKKHIKIFKKYIIFKKEIFFEVEKFMRKNFYKKKVLGVHFRGTDMKTQERHPFPATFEQIVSYVDKEIKYKKYDKIFLVTEELDYFERLKFRYKDKICYYNSYRSNNPDIFDNIKRKNHRYLIGKENIIDMFLLAKTKSIICTNSNMADASIFISNNKKKIIRIHNGYNSNNILIAQISWYLKKMLPEFLGGFKLAKR